MKTHRHHNRAWYLSALVAVGSSWFGTGPKAAADVEANTVTLTFEHRATVLDEGQPTDALIAEENWTALVGALAPRVGPLEQVTLTRNVSDGAAKAVAATISPELSVRLDTIQVVEISAPVFDDDRFIADWAQGLVWHGASNEATATLSFVRFRSSPTWVLGDGQVTITASGAVHRIGIADDNRSVFVKELELADATFPDPVPGPKTGQADRGKTVERTTRIQSGPTHRATLLVAIGSDRTLTQGTSFANTGVTNFNQALVNSSSPSADLTDTDVVIVGYYKGSRPSLTRVADDGDQLDALAADTVLADMGHAVGADLITGIFAGWWTNFHCGLAYLEYRYAVVSATQCTHTIPHELGHNYGAWHESCPAGWVCEPTWARAYNHTDDDVTRKTIMWSSSGSGGTTYLNFSNPERDFVGTDYDSGTETRKNAWRINEIAPIIASFEADPGPAGGKYTPLAFPTRVLDTRPAPQTVGAYDTPFTANVPRQMVVISPTAGIPAGATGVAINVTVVNPASNGWLRLWPEGQTEPGSSTTNFMAGQTRASMTIAVPGQFGLINIKTTATTNVIVDVLGYFGGNSSTTGYHTVDPYRPYDTRNAPNTAFNPGETRAIQITGTGPVGGGGVPAKSGDNVTAVVVNVTAVSPAGNGWLLLSPYGSGTASSLNYQTGVNIANLHIVQVDSTGKIRVKANTSATHVLIDVVGYIGDGGLTYLPNTPTRPDNMPLTLTATSLTATGDLPGATTPVAFVNITGSSATAPPTYLSALPTTATTLPPATSTTNMTSGYNANANHTFVTLDSNDEFNVYNHAGNITLNVDLIARFA